MRELAAGAPRYIGAPHTASTHTASRPTPHLTNYCITLTVSASASPSAHHTCSQLHVVAGYYI